MTKRFRRCQTEEQELTCSASSALRSGWAGLPCLSPLPLSRSCAGTCHSSERLCKASAPVFGCAESCRDTAPSQGDPTLSCFRLTGEPSASISGSRNGWEGDTPLLAAPYLPLLWCLAPPGMQFAEGELGTGLVLCS